MDEATDQHEAGEPGGKAAGRVEPVAAESAPSTPESHPSVADNIRSEGQGLDAATPASAVATPETAASEGVAGQQKAPTKEAASPPNGSAWALRRRALWREWVKPLLIIGTVMFSFRSSVADWNDVPTGSMKPTILEGDRIFINKVAYDLKFPFTTWRLMEWDDPSWGDIVVLRSPEDNKRLVKRVVGLPGDVVEIRRSSQSVSHLFVNGQPAQYDPLDSGVVQQLDGDQQFGHLFWSETLHGRDHAVMVTPSGGAMPRGPFVVPEGMYWVMGDNRDNSRDSRAFGPVPREAILGQATAVALSLDRDEYYLPRWKRFFSALH